MFNPFTKLDEQVSITVVSDGIESLVPGYLYRCDGLSSMGTCRLVWDRAYLAKECADHGHRQSWIKEYRSQDGTVAKYTRAAVRRDTKAPAPATQPVPQAVAAMATALSPEDQLRALADSLGFRVSRKPVSKTPEFEIKDLEGSELPF